MGRIFETRKHRMFARFAKMSQAFNRVRKEIEIAVKVLIPKPIVGFVWQFKMQKVLTCRRIV